MPDPETSLTPVPVPPEEALASQAELLDLENALAQSRTFLSSLVPAPVISLTNDERAAVDRQNQLSLLMGAAGVAPLTCSEECPFRGECSLWRMNPKRHPVGQLCPFEVEFLRERFLEWMGEIGRDLTTLLASERLAVSNLCSLELELQRIRKVLSRPANAEMNQVSVRDVNAETGEALCWENVIHTAAQREDQILLNIRMIMKDFELTPEQRTKRAKALGLRSDRNMASRQSELFDRIRERNRRPAIAATVVETS